jgi:hypothetical protein
MRKYVMDRQIMLTICPLQEGTNLIQTSNNVKKN